MIFESSHWKEPLLKAALRFRRFKTRKRLTDPTITQIEKDVFIGFYAIRKLCDARGKITDRIRNSSWQCRVHTNVQTVTSHNNHKIEENYDMMSHVMENKDLAFICGRIIHSVVFMVASNDNGGFYAIFFTSDHDRNRKLYYLSVDQLVNIFESVGNDWVVSYRWEIDPSTGGEVIETK